MKLLVVAITFLCLVSLPIAFSTPRQGKASSTGSKYVPVSGYDPKRDAEKDINEAVVEARRTGKNVLVQVGGDWCGWCHIMDKFYENNAELLALRKQNFILVKVNFSQQNENQKALSRYPKIPGFPHIFILNQEGELLHSKNTGELESGKSYDLAKFLSFLKEFSPEHK
jgi:thiol:disulfide interchange protein